MRVASLLFHDVYVGDVDESGFSSDAANRYKLSLRDFDAQLAALAGVRADAPILATDLTGSRRAFPFLITFDDGGVSYYTIAAERLDALGWRGHCFVSTDFIGRRGFLNPSQIRELDARPIDYRPIEDQVLVYTSVPLPDDLHVVGPITAVLYAASSSRDTDWVVRLCDV